MELSQMKELSKEGAAETESLSGRIYDVIIKVIANKVA
jgi:hypothetical protein